MLQILMCSGRRKLIIIRSLEIIKDMNTNHKSSRTCKTLQQIRVPEPSNPPPRIWAFGTWREIKKPYNLADNGISEGQSGSLQFPSSGKIYRLFTILSTIPQL